MEDNLILVLRELVEEIATLNQHLSLITKPIRDKQVEETQQEDKRSEMANRIIFG